MWSGRLPPAAAAAGGVVRWIRESTRGVTIALTVLRPGTLTRVGTSGMRALRDTSARHQHHHSIVVVVGDVRVPTPSKAEGRRFDLAAIRLRLSANCGDRIAGDRGNFRQVISHSGRRRTVLPVRTSAANTASWAMPT